MRNTQASLRSQGLSDIEILARKYDPDPPRLDPGLPRWMLSSQPFTRSGDLRKDILTLLRMNAANTLMDLARAAGTNDRKVSKLLQEMVADGTVTQDEVYKALPKLAYVHQWRGLSLLQHPKGV